jgi:Fur family ferric uptake transcriptional regulator
MTAVHSPRPLRETRQAAVVEQALASSAEFRTAQDLHAQLRTDGMRIGLTTVYRHLQRLSDAGAVDTVRTRTGEVAYRRCADQGHHHHLVCQGCGRVVDIDGPSVENWLDEVAKRAGFTDIEHTLELTGTCRDCARARGGTRASRR